MIYLDVVVPVTPSTVLMTYGGHCCLLIPHTAFPTTTLVVNLFPAVHSGVHYGVLRFYVTAFVTAFTIPIPVATPHYF